MLLRRLRNKENKESPKYSTYLFKIKNKQYQKHLIYIQTRKQIYNLSNPKKLQSPKTPQTRHTITMIPSNPNTVPELMFIHHIEVYIDFLFLYNLFFMTLLILIQLLLLIFQVGSRNLLSRLGTQSSAFYRCFRQSGFNQLLTLIQGGQDGFSGDEIEGLNNAKNSGILVDVTISPCRGREPEEELKFLIGQVGQGVLHKIFAVPESEEDFCDWSSNTPASNCQYLQKFLQLGKKYNVTIGVGSSIDVWEQSFGSTTACPEVSNSPLYWFPNEDQFDLNPDFRSYHQFGGWKVPYMKMYNMTRVCNKGFQVNYFV